MSMCARLIVLGKIPDSPNHRIQKAATTLLCDTIQNRDFALLVARRASKALDPISGFHVAQILPVICKAARASRPELAVGTLRMLCNGVCTAKRFHVDNEEQTCRVGCSDEPDCLSHYNRCPLLPDILVTIWRNAGIHLRGTLFHDLITQILYRSLQHGILVVEIIDAFLHAHNYHRHNTDNPEKVEDCNGRKDSPCDGYHAVLRPCVPSPLSHRMLGWRSLLKVPLTQPNHHAKKGDDFKGWARFTDGGTLVNHSWMPLPAHPMEDLPLRRILRMQEPDSIPTTPQNSRV